MSIDLTEPKPRRTAPAGTFGPLLRRWRQARGTSQLDLALTCDTSQRHISFLESGRARPSRGMVLNLAGALAVPLRHQDALLLAAGFAPAFGARPAEAPELKPVRAVLDRMLERQEPYPAIVVDRHYNLLQANGAALRLIGWLLDGQGPGPDGPPPNVLSLLFSPPVDGVVENLAELALWTVRRLRAEAVMEDPLAEDPPLLKALLAHPVMEAAAKRIPALDAVATVPALTVRFAKGGVRLSLLSVIATLGTPLDAGLQDLRVELFFPADEATRRWFEAG